MSQVTDQLPYDHGNDGPRLLWRHLYFTCLFIVYEGNYWII